MTELGDRKAKDRCSGPYTLVMRSSRFVRLASASCQLRPFAWADIREVATTYTIGTGAGAPAAELIIMGGTLARHDSPWLL